MSKSHKTNQKSVPVDQVFHIKNQSFRNERRSRYRRDNYHHYEDECCAVEDQTVTDGYYFVQCILCSSMGLNPPIYRLNPRYNIYFNEINKKLIVLHGMNIYIVLDNPLDHS